MFFEPLAQFDIYPLLGRICTYFYNVSFAVTLAFGFLLSFFLVVGPFRNVQSISRKESFLLFVGHFLNIIIQENINSKKKNFTIYLIIIFLLILIFNISGMIPFSIAITSFFIVSFYISLGAFVSLNIVGLSYNRGGYWKLLLPDGIPTVISLFLVNIELISYIAKVFSLATRLFANMMSGHSLLKILMSFSWVIIFLNFSVAYVSIVPLVIVFLAISLEFMIAFLQTYVYLTLTTIYLNDTVILH
jgi:ATP synthase subunit 6